LSSSIRRWRRGFGRGSGGGACGGLGGGLGGGSRGSWGSSGVVYKLFVSRR